MTSNHKPVPPANKNISISGDVNGIVIVGDHNTARQTIIQQFFNIFKSDAETLEQRNPRILLGHVENAWTKGLNHAWKNCRIVLIGSFANLGSQANHENQGKESICSMKI